MNKRNKYIQGVPDCDNLQIGSSIPLFAHFATLSVKLDFLGLGLLHASFEEGCAKWDYYLRSLVEPYFETLSIKQIIVCISKHINTKENISISTTSCGLAFLILVTSNQNWYMGDFLESFLWFSMDHSGDNFTK